MANQPADVSAHSHIEFWSKGPDRDFQIMLFFQRNGFRPAAKTFHAGEGWKKHTFKISDFAGCDGTDVLGVFFGSDKTGEFEFQIDSIRLTDGS